MSNEAVSISTSKYIKTVKAKIDGHVYTVRKLGAGEALDMSMLASEAQKGEITILNLRGKYEKAQTEEEKMALVQEISEAMMPLARMNERIKEIYYNLFDDGEDGSRTKKLVDSLGMENMRKVYDEIMGAIDEKSA